MQFFILLGSFMQYMMSMELPQEKNLCMCVSEFSFSWGNSWIDMISKPEPLWIMHLQLYRELDCFVETVLQVQVQ